MNEALKQQIQTRKELLEGIKSELIERLQLDIDQADLEDDTFLFGAGLQLDSIDAMEIIIGMEARFGVELHQNDLAAMRTFNTLADRIATGLAESGGAVPSIH